MVIRVDGVKAVVILPPPDKTDGLWKRYLIRLEIQDAKERGNKAA